MVTTPVPGQPTLVQLNTDQYLEGREDEESGQRRFLGIPFALPPVDELRWKAPQPPDESWTGTRDASRFGDSCFQTRSGFTIGTNISEDCLFLNVYTPPKADSGDLPVLVFFYGGSWDTGSASCPLYYGGNVVDLSGESAILVTVNYRLNVFGFMGGESLRDHGAGGTTGNWGLLDQRESLRWVQRHIASFGGDPTRVTIFGESAGAGSVATHLASPNSYSAVSSETGNPLFTRGMMESGNPYTAWNSQNMALAETRLSRVAVNAGCSNGSAPLDASGAACLRSLSAQELFDAKHSGVGGPFLTWSPVEDGVELDAAPRDLMAQGLFAGNASVLLGTNADEGSEFIDLPYDATQADYEDYMMEILGSDLGALALAEYPYADFNGTQDGKVPGHGGFWACARAVGDAFFSCPARQTVRAFSSPPSSTPPPSVRAAAAAASARVAYEYFFNHTLELLVDVEPYDPDDVDPLGVFHGSELPFVFDFDVSLVSEDEKALAQALVAFWTSFAATADPNSSGSAGTSAHWPAYSSEADIAMVLVTPPSTAAAPTSGLKQAKCDFWDANPIPSEVVFGAPDF